MILLLGNEKTQPQLLENRLVVATWRILYLPGDAGWGLVGGGAGEGGGAASGFTIRKSRMRGAHVVLSVLAPLLVVGIRGSPSLSRTESFLRGAPLLNPA